MDFKTENFAFFLFFLLGKGKANYLSRKVILEKNFKVFHRRYFERPVLHDKAVNFYFLPSQFLLSYKSIFTIL